MVLPLIKKVVSIFCSIPGGSFVAAPIAASLIPSAWSLFLCIWASFASCCATWFGFDAESNPSGETQPFTMSDLRKRFPKGSPAATASSASMSAYCICLSFVFTTLQTVCMFNNQMPF